MDNWDGPALTAQARAGFLWGTKKEERYWLTKIGLWNEPERTYLQLRALTDALRLSDIHKRLVRQLVDVQLVVDQLWQQGADEE